jgi:hypothetical protein
MRVMWADVHDLLARIGQCERVLDVGGGFHPLARVQRVGKLGGDLT